MHCEQREGTRGAGSSSTALAWCQRGCAPFSVVSYTAGGAALLLILGGIIGIGHQRGLYDWPMAYLLFVSATSLGAGIATWRAMDHLRRIDSDRQTFFNFSIDLFAVADFQGQFLRVNPSFTRTLGWTSTELISRPFADFIHPEDREATLAELEKLRSGAPVLKFDNRYRHKDGSWRTLSWRSYPIIDQGLIYASARDVTELRRTESQLRKSEENLSVTLHSIGDAVLVTDAQGIVTRLNPVAERLTGWTEAEAVGMPIDKVLVLVHERTRDPVAVPVNRVLETNEVQGLAQYTVVVDRNGVECPVADSAAPIRNREGDVIGVVMIMRDISGERAVEAAMQRVNKDLDRRVRERTAELEKAKAMLEQSHEGLLLAQKVARMGSFERDLLMQTDSWSEQMFHLTGLRNDGAAPAFSDLLQVFCADDRKRILGAVEQATGAGRTTSVQVRTPESESTPQKHFIMTVSGVRSAEGRIIKLSGTLQDITEQKRSEAALAETRERLELAVRAANIGMWDWNIRTGEVYYSAEYHRQLGYGDDGWNQYTDWSDRLHPDDRERAIAALDTYLKQPRGTYVQEFRLRHKDGTYRWIHSQGALVSKSGESGLRMLGTHVDVTEQKRLEEQFIQAQKMESVGRLAGGVAHDFNNLLSVINGYADLALNSLPEDAEERSDINEIRKAGDRAAHLTRQLLAFSRKQVLQPVVIDVPAHLSEIQKMLKRLIGEDIEIAFETEPKTARVRIDPGQLEQVVVNLAVNSRDAMPYGGKLTIVVRPVKRADVPGAGADEPDEFVSITVADTGVGMDRATLERMYEPFYTTKREGKGTGLGLSTVYGIVKQSGGHITAFSEAGRGTAIHVFLPAVGEAPRPKQTPPPSVRTAGHETILLVEDDDFLQRLTDRLLTASGYNVVKASNGVAALKVMASLAEPPSLLLTDVVMPEMSGPELVRRLREQFPNIKVLYMSGYADDTLAHLDNLSEAEFIGKPFEPAQLTARVQEVLAAATGSSSPV